MHSQTHETLPNVNNKMNYHQRDFTRPQPSIAFPSTEILLRNIQELLKVVLENSIQQEQQLSFEKGEQFISNTKRLIYEALSSPH